MEPGELTSTIHPTPSDSTLKELVELGGCQAVLRGGATMLVELKRSDPSSKRQQRLLDKVRELGEKEYNGGVVPLYFDDSEIKKDYVIWANNQAYELRVNNQPILQTANPDEILGSIVHHVQYSGTQLLAIRSEPKKFEINHGKGQNQYSSDLTNVSAWNLAFDNLDYGSRALRAFTFKNLEPSTALNLSIFKCGPDWEISQVFPLKTDYETVHPGFEVQMDLDLKKGSNQGFQWVWCITIQPTSFGSWKMHAMNTNPKTLGNWPRSNFLPAAPRIATQSLITNAEFGLTTSDRGAAPPERPDGGDYTSPYFENSFQGVPDIGSVRIDRR